MAADAACFRWPMYPGIIKTAGHGFVPVPADARDCGYDDMLSEENFQLQRTASKGMASTCLGRAACSPFHRLRKIVDWKVMSPHRQ